MCPTRRARGPFLRIQNCRSAGTREGFAMAKILIVDDEPRIRELIEEHLEHEGYQCTQASDGAAALAAVAAVA